MFHRLALLVATIALAGSSARSEDGPTASLRMEKDVYVHGEPIGIVVTFHNPGPEIVAIGLSPVPDFLEAAFTMTGKGLRPLPGQPMDVYGISARIRIPAAGRLEAKVYLQRYLRQPEPGTHQIEVHFEEPYYAMGTIDTAAGPLGDFRATGRFTFKVAPPSKEDLHRSLEGLVEVLERGERSGRVIFPECSAIEALSLVTDPVVLPLLDRVLDEDPEALFEVLGYFRHFEEARSMALRRLNSERGSVVMAALLALADWGVAIPRDAWAKLVARSRDDETVQVALEEYDQARKRPRRGNQPRAWILPGPHAINDVRPSPLPRPTPIAPKKG